MVVHRWSGVGGAARRSHPDVAQLDDPAAELWPAGQSVQADEAAAALYVSVGQGMHWPELVAPDVAEKVPARQLGG